MMSQVTTRSKQVNSVIQTLEGSSMCVIPSDLLRILLEDTFTLQAETNKVNESIAKSLDAIVNKLDSHMNEQLETFLVKIFQCWPIF